MAVVIEAGHFQIVGNAVAVAVFQCGKGAEVVNFDAVAKAIAVAVGGVRNVSAVFTSKGNIGAGFPVRFVFIAEAVVVAVGGGLGNGGGWSEEIGRLEIGRLGDWEIGRLGDWEACPERSRRMGKSPFLEP